MEKEIFSQGKKQTVPKVFPEMKMNKFHAKYKDAVMAHFAIESHGFEEEKILECEEEICKQSIDDKFKEYSAQQEDHWKELEEFEVQASNEYRKYMDKVVKNCYMEPLVLQMVHQRFILAAIEKHGKLSREKIAVLEEYLEHSVEDEYTRVSENVMGRKGHHRELSHDEAMDSVKKAIKGLLLYLAGKIWSSVKNFLGF